MKTKFALAFFLLASSSSLAQQKPLLLPEETVAAMAGELSGETAKRNLEYISRLHRTRSRASA